MKLPTDQPNAVDYDVRCIAHGEHYEDIAATFTQAKKLASIWEKSGYTDIEIVAQDPDEAIAWWSYRNGKAIRTE